MNLSTTIPTTTPGLKALHLTETTFSWFPATWNCATVWTNGEILTVDSPPYAALQRLGRLAGEGGLNHLALKGRHELQRAIGAWKSYSSESPSKIPQTFVKTSHYTTPVDPIGYVEYESAAGDIKPAVLLANESNTNLLTEIAYPYWWLAGKMYPVAKVLIDPKERGIGKVLFIVEGEVKAIVMPRKGAFKVVTDFETALAA